MLYWIGLTSEISIHALREEGDRVLSFGVQTSNEFLSTPSARRATLYTASYSY